MYDLISNFCADIYDYETEEHKVVERHNILVQNGCLLLHTAIQWGPGNWSPGTGTFAGETGYAFSTKYWIDGWALGSGGGSEGFTDTALTTPITGLRRDRANGPSNQLQSVGYEAAYHPTYSCAGFRYNFGGGGATTQNAFLQTSVCNGYGSNWSYFTARGNLPLWGGTDSVGYLRGVSFNTATAQLVYSWQLDRTFPTTASGIDEAILTTCNDGTNSAFAKVSFTPIDKTAANRINFYWTVSF